MLCGNKHFMAIFQENFGKPVPETVQHLPTLSSIILFQDTRNGLKQEMIRHINSYYHHITVGLKTASVFSI